MPRQCHKYVKHAFDTVTPRGVPPWQMAEQSNNDHFVSLYEETCEYGGPEEGGWWRHDRILVSAQRFSSESLALEALATIQKRAGEMSADAQRRWSEHCQREVTWCEDRGLDCDSLPEPDGPSKYVVVVEKVTGSLEYRAPTHYE